ncbi:GNAT family N-acetyltransferase [Rhodocytophaga rosea]|uniref:GNAT family N-acetyltransferase n=1 Tax=Rhodocytophaga rosea TaxID=2704465 RepID=A0A6C0GT63_9BACT|nr:GNAT family protein [Rhodocytophaga rosea]QHT71355.1 GNAT family N-acetyltransferase [Rhodocytophaga rosea]
MKEDLLGVPETLQNSRILLKRYQEGEGKLVYALIRDNKIRLQDHFPRTISQITDEQKAELYVRNKMAEWYGQKGYFFGIWEKSSQTYIGQISVKNIDWEIPRAEIGYYISKEYEGRGLMTEVVKLIIKFSFEQLKVRKLFLRTTPSNARSSKLAENCGFVKEGWLRKDFLKADKTLVDIIYYGITLQDFQGMKL